MWLMSIVDEDLLSVVTILLSEFMDQYHKYLVDLAGFVIARHFWWLRGAQETGTP